MNGYNPTAPGKLATRLFAMLFAVMQCLSSVAMAQSGLDLDPPKINHAVPKQLEAGKPLRLNATITDENGVAEATVYYRRGQTGAYDQLPMRNIGGDEYTALLMTEKGQKSIAYYIEVLDDGGNRLVEGAPDKPLLVAAASTARSGNSKYLYIVLGVLAVGALAGASGGSSGSSGGASANTTPLTLSVPVPQ